MADIYLSLLLGATVYFAQPDALRVSLSVHTDLTSYYPLPPPKLSNTSVQIDV